MNEFCLFFVFSPTNVELSTHKFREQFNSTFPHHFEFKRLYRTFLAEHYDYTKFNFVNGYLATSYERIGDRNSVIYLWERIEEIYPEW